MLNTLIGRDHHIETGFFSRVDQPAIDELGPAQLPRRLDVVARKKPPQTIGTFWSSRMEAIGGCELQDAANAVERHAFKNFGCDRFG